MRACEDMTILSVVPRYARKVSTERLGWRVVQEGAGFSVLGMNVTAWESSIVSHDIASHGLRKRKHTPARADDHLVFLPNKVTRASKLGLWVSPVGESEGKTGIIFDRVDTPELRRGLREPRSA